MSAFSVSADLVAKEYLDVINNNFKFKNYSDIGSAAEFLNKINSACLQSPYHEYQKKFIPIVATAEENKSATCATAREYLSKMNAIFSHKQPAPFNQTVHKVTMSLAEDKRSSWKKIHKKSSKTEPCAISATSDGDELVGFERNVASEYLRAINRRLTFAVYQVQDLGIKKSNENLWKRIRNLAKKLKGHQSKRGKKCAREFVQ